MAHSRAVAATAVLTASVLLAALWSVTVASASTRAAPLVPEPDATVVSAPLVATTTLGLLASARHSVELEMYELGDPGVVAALEAAHRRGVAVRVVTDPTERESRASDAELSRAGVAVRTLAVRGGIDHVKLLVVDDSRVLVGGVNLGSASFATTDADVELSGAAVGDAAAVFARDWAAAGGSGAPASGVVGPFVTGRSIEPEMLAVVAHATGQCMVLANYLTDYGVQDALAAAARRGVAVTVVLNPTAYGASGAASWLVRHGVHVERARDEPYLHAKILACGAMAMIGSANFSYDAMTVNHELDVVLDGGAAATLDAFAAQVARADA
jgi:cardiolipin synthase